MTQSPALRRAFAFFRTLPHTIQRKEREGMEQIIVDIPKEETWEPPVVRKEDIPEEHASAADVFFMQYAVCILVLTAAFLLRLLDGEAYSGVTAAFREQSAAPDLPWTNALISLVTNLWK